MLSAASSHCILTVSCDFYPKIRRRRVENFGGDLELKRLELTWSGQVDSVDLTAATLRSSQPLAFH